MNNGVLAVLDEAIQKAQFTLNWFTDGDVQKIKQASITIERMAAVLDAVSKLRQLGAVINGSRETMLFVCDAADAALAEFNGGQQS